jgi:8-oxo-dGTP pyrophosphatase MutT (NUDIX family)
MWEHADHATLRGGLFARARAHYVDGVYGLDVVAKKLMRLGRDPGGPDVPTDPPRAAVAAILREGRNGDGAELLFIRRAEAKNDVWSGHIAFPGGRRDPEDATLLATAIRETKEEVGIDLERGELVARLVDVPAFKRSKRGVLVVAPFVFVMREEVVPTPNYEVAGTLWVPVSKLAGGEGKGTYSFTWQEQTHELPCYRLGAEQHVLWGMTHSMVESILETVAKD